ncbi:unnamed protein product, partial [Mesorhabditis belari]|uniref:DUF7064 domain-containing protein n=1 Tax=Mesorhabditis belari TaxID=2138241 RepID=A0AAF3F2Y8_9BILA
MFCLIIGLFIAYIGFYTLSRPDPMPINLIYGVPGKWYWLKFRLMRFVIGRRQKKAKAGKKSDDLMRSQFGGSGQRKIEDLEKKHEFPSGKDWAADAVFFDAANSDGWYFTLGTAQRQKDIINLFFILRVPGMGVFVNEELTMTTNVQSIPSEDEWKTKSFTVKCIKPMEKWTISFKGKLTNSPGLRYFGPEVGSEAGPENQPSEKAIPGEIELEWNNFGDYFDFDTEVSPTSIAHSLAIEPWSRDLFKRLQESHQTHYEQFGFLTGRVRVGEKEFNDIRMTSMRDHTITSFRRWTDIRRYIMMIYHLSDGTCIHTSLISMPETVFSHLEFGYVITPDKQKIPVDRIHLHLSNVGEKKRFPEHFEYSFDAGKFHYDVKVKIIETCSFKMGEEQKCQVNENMAEFEANGVKGYGFVEAEYRIQPF